MIITQALKYSSKAHSSSVQFNFNLSLKQRRPFSSLLLIYFTWLIL